MCLKRSSLTLPQKFLLVLGILAQNLLLSKTFPDPRIRRGPLAPASCIFLRSTDCGLFSVCTVGVSTISIFPAGL